MGPMYWNAMDIMNGPGDEFGLTERTHSSNWIRTEYRNQRTPDQFYTFGPQENGGQVSVSLLDARALRETKGVRLSWQVASDEDIPGFWLYRDVDGTRTRANVEMVTASPWLDTGAPDYAFAYWLTALNRAGETYWLGPIPVGAREDGLRLVTSPNPFHESARFALLVSTPGRVRLRVMDFSGREVRVLFDAHAAPGSVEVTWDGRDHSGRRVSPGAYVIVATEPTGTLTRKVLLLP